MRSEVVVMLSMSTCAQVVKEKRGRERSELGAMRVGDVEGLARAAKGLSGRHQGARVGKLAGAANTVLAGLCSESAWNSP